MGVDDQVKNAIKRLSVFIIVIIVTLSILLIMGLIINSRYVILGFSFSLILVCITISASLLIIIQILDKLLKKNMILSIAALAIVILFAFSSCFTIRRMSDYIKNNEVIHNLSIKGLPDSNEIVLYEYDALRSKSGCLCYSINKRIYKKIPGTDFGVAPNLSLTDSHNLVVIYNSEDGTLNMKYKTTEIEKYNEKTIPLKK